MSLYNELFGWFDMVGNYEERVVKNDQTAKFTVDTVLVTDRSWQYETAVAHKDFNNGDWIILEGADTKEEAIEVHEKWLAKLSSDDVTELVDCFTSAIYHKQKGVE